MKDYELWEQYNRGMKEFMKSSIKQPDEFLNLHKNIEENGITEPIRIQLLNRSYYVEDGAHRWASSSVLNRKDIPAYIGTRELFWPPGYMNWHPSVYLFKDKQQIDIPYDANGPKVGKVFKYIPAKKKDDILEYWTNWSNSYRAYYSVFSV